MAPGVELVGFAVASMVVGIVVHEFGHAIVARLCGSHVLSIRIGAGPVVLRLGRLELRLLPAGGLTRITKLASRWRQVMFALAGPLANLLAALLAATAFRHALEPGTDFVVAIQVGMGLGNLIPRDSKLSAAGTDGRQLVRALRRPRPTLAGRNPDAERRKTLKVAEALVNQGRGEGARALLVDQVGDDQPQWRQAQVQRLLNKIDEPTS